MSYFKTSSTFLSTDTIRYILSPLVLPIKLLPNYILQLKGSSQPSKNTAFNLRITVQSSPLIKCFKQGANAKWKLLPPVASFWVQLPPGRRSHKSLANYQGIGKIPGRGEEAVAKRIHPSHSHFSAPIISKWMRMCLWMWLWMHNYGRFVGRKTRREPLPFGPPPSHSWIHHLSPSFPPHFPPLTTLSWFPLPPVAQAKSAAATSIK